jgi:anti-anti-sigma factor
MSILTVSFEVRSDFTVAVVAGPLSAETADAFREQFENWLVPLDAPPRVILDLAGVDLMDSSGLGALLGAWRRVSERDGYLCLACLQQRPRLLFEITRAYSAFNIFETVDDAMGGGDDA